MIQGAQWMLGYAKSSNNALHPGWLYRDCPFETNWRIW